MKLTILSTSDTHGYVYPTNYVKKGSTQGFGLARAATVLAREQAAAEGPVVTIENGDFLEGPRWPTTSLGSRPPATPNRS